jgi:leucyl-tRNA synthetase
MGSYTEGGDWSDEGIQGTDRFIKRVWRLAQTIMDNPPEGEEAEQIIKLEWRRHYTIKHVTQDLERFQFNTAISRIMELVNDMYLYQQNVDVKEQNRKELIITLETLIRLIAPFAPHLGEELWEQAGKSDSVFNNPWPAFSEKKLILDQVTIVVQVNGKLRGRIEVDRDSEDEAVLQEALNNPNVKNHLEGKHLIKSVVVQNKLVSLVVK